MFGVLYARGFGARLRSIPTADMVSAVIDGAGKAGQTMATKWLGTPPTHCDLCEGKLAQVFVDGRTNSGQWGIICPACRVQHGPRKLGTGMGQKYRLNLGTKEWDKVEG